MADYKAGPQGQDDYQSDDSEEVEVIKPHGRTKQPGQDQDYDVEMNHSNMQTSAKNKTARKGRKRKSVEVNEDENEHGSPLPKQRRLPKLSQRQRKYRLEKPGRRRRRRKRDQQCRIFSTPSQRSGRRPLHHKAIPRVSSISPCKLIAISLLRYRDQRRYR